MRPEMFVTILCCVIVLTLESVSLASKKFSDPLTEVNIRYNQADKHQYYISFIITDKWKQKR